MFSLSSVKYNHRMGELNFSRGKNLILQTHHMETVLGITAALPYTVTFSQHPSLVCQIDSQLQGQEVSLSQKPQCAELPRCFCTVPRWVPSRWQGSPPKDTADATCPAASPWSLHRPPSRARACSHNTDVHQTVQRCSGWHLHKDDPKLKCAKFQEPDFVAEACVSFSVLYSHHELIRMMHTGPLWEKPWVRQAGASRKTLTVSAHSFPAFFSHIWPSFPVRILHHHYPFDLCSLLTGQSSSCLWHVE